MKVGYSAIKVFAHDSYGGVRGSAAFLALYDLLQKIDESYTENNKLKRSGEKIDVFSTVTRLRTDRSGMVDTYEAYKLLYLCLAYYGPNRSALKALAPLKFPAKRTRCLNNDAPNLARTSGNDNDYRDSDEITDDEEVPYVLHNPSDREISEFLNNH